MEEDSPFFLTRRARPTPWVEIAFSALILLIATTIGVKVHQAYLAGGEATIPVARVVKVKSELEVPNTGPVEPQSIWELNLAEAIFSKTPLISEAPNYANCRIMKCLALTYDDGPSAFTWQLLDILSNHNAKASFFVLGNRAEGYASYLARMSDEGHDVGSHSWAHDNLVRIPHERIHSDLSGTTNAISTYSNRPVKFFRPPYGNINDSVRQITSDLNQRITLWDIDPQDWKHKDAARICELVVAHAYPGSVILLHDIYSTSIDATECILSRLSSEYTFVNLSTLYR